MPDPYRYRAFISYSRADRAQAKLLQERLERYVLPQAMRLVKPGLRYDSRPLKPIFRDEDELVPGQDLPTRIRLGLERSEFLIVVCSPSAVASEWVNKEILDFVGLGGRERVLAVLVDGEPNAVARGLPAEKECLPAALRFEHNLRENADGRMVAEVSDRAAEPLWVDERKGIQGERTMFLRLVAALLSLASLDELIDRDRAYRRRRTLFAWLGGFAIAVAILCFAVLLGLQMHREAIRNSNTLVGLAQRAVKDGDWESSARYAVLGMKGAESPLIGFNARTAEDALAGAVMDNRRIGAPRSLVSDGGAVSALSQNGMLVAVASKAGAVQLFDTTAGESHGTVFQVGEFDAFAVSPDGRLVATHTQSGNDTGEQGQFRIWDVSTGKQLFKTLNYESPSAMTIRMWFSPDNRMLGCIGEFGDGGAYAILFDIASGRSVDLAAGAEGISSLAFSPDSTLIAAAWPQGIQIWHTATARPATGVMKIASQSVYSQIAISPDDKTLAVGTTESTLIYWDLEKKSVTLNENLAAGPIASVGFSSSGKRFGVQFRSGLVEVWAADNLSEDLANEAMKFMPGGSFAFLSDDRRMATLASGALRLWKLEGYDRDLPLNTPVAAGIFSPDGSVLVVLGRDGRMVPLNAKTLEPIGPAVTFQGDKRQSAGDQRLAFSPDGKWVAHQNAAGTWVVNWRNGEQWRVPGGSYLFGAIAFSPDSKTLAAAVDWLGDYTSKASDPRESAEIRRWDVLSHQEVGKMIKVPVLANVLSFAPGGQLMAIGSEYNEVMLWDQARNVRVSPSIDGTRFAVLLPDGKRLLTNGSNHLNGSGQVLQLWDVASGTGIGPEMRLDTGKVSQVVFVGDGTRALVAGEESMVVWDLITAEEIGIPFELNQKIEAASFSPDLQELSVLTDQHVYRWNLNDGLHLNGRALANASCKTLLPGNLSKLNAQELAAAPVLDPKLNSDACAR